jgi:probable rRNA maturation factor
MLIVDNQTEIKVHKRKLRAIQEHMTNKAVELIVCHNDYIKDLNRQYRNIDEATDVLSFPIIDEIGLSDTIGTIVISADFIKEGAKKFNHRKRDEISLLFIHGVLHLLGYDHEIDNGEMRERERELIEKFELPHSLIVRVEDSEDI